jgi:molybdopterin-guanine dinucleotide biosynthesis protein A
VLANFHPSRDLVFVVSCDLPGFDSAIVRHLTEAIGQKAAAVPQVNGRLQPLCALYRTASLDVARELVQGGERRVMRWLERLDYVVVDDIEVAWATNVNTPIPLSSCDDVCASEEEGDKGDGGSANWE